MKPDPTQFPAAERRAFRRALLRWFDAHQRALPWRANRDPYRVWVSEIMLQQTRVAAVLEPYRRFLESFPTVAALAGARPARVLASWSGLGYYRRARMLQAAARQIVGEGKGRLPHDAAGWQSLPGIGRYTAAAVASICYGERCAVVDGNVRRVLNRLLGRNGGSPRNAPGILSAPDAWRLADELLSTTRPGDFNQAMMELGATVCVPTSPDCGLCPVRPWCRAVAGISEQGCVPTSNSRRPTRIKTELACALITSAERVWLVPRGRQESVMPGMWELPQAPPAETGMGVGLPQPAGVLVRHAIMNTDYVVHVARIEWRDRDRPFHTELGGKWFKAAHAAKLPLTGLARKILRRCGII